MRPGQNETPDNEWSDRRETAMDNGTYRSCSTRGTIEEEGNKAMATGREATGLSHGEGSA